MGPRVGLEYFTEYFKLKFPKKLFKSRENLGTIAFIFFYSKFPQCYGLCVGGPPNLMQLWRRLNIAFVVGCCLALL